MSKTRAELATLSLQMMRVVEGDATPDTNDQTLLEEAYDQVYAVLVRKHLVTWGPTDSIPDEAINPVAAMTASSRLSFFKVPPDTQQIILIEASNAIESLTEILSLDYVSDTIPSEPL